MSLTFWGRKHTKVNTKLLDILEACKYKEKLAKEVTTKKLKSKIDDKYVYFLIFSKPAKVTNVNFKEQKIDIKMRLRLSSLDYLLPENSGTAIVQYKFSYEAFSKKLQLRGATITEMSFANDLKDALQKGVKKSKSAGKLNLDLEVGKCFG